VSYIAKSLYQKEQNMRTGRPPKPSNLRLIEGNRGHRPINQKEPAFEPELPAPPVFLCAQAVEEWKRVAPPLYRQRLLTAVDRAALAAYCQACGRWVQAEDALARMAKADMLTDALMIKTHNGSAVQNPLVGIANTAMRDMMRFAQEFGFTPSARTRLSGHGGDSSDPASKFFS